MNTIIITNKEEIDSKIKANLALLRETDSVVSSDYETAPEKIYEIRPEIVIICEHDERDKTLAIIKSIRDKHIYKNTQIILMVNEYDRSFILKAYDEGIDEFVSINSDSSDFLIRIINSIKKVDLLNKINVYTSNLKTYGILESKSGFYNSKYEHDIFDIEMHMNNYKNGCYMIVTVDDNSKKSLSSETIVEAIQKSVRSGDYIAGLSGAKYSIMVKSGLDGCLKILNKIDAELNEVCNIKAGIAVIDCEKFEEIKKKATCALNNALLKDIKYSIYSELDNSGDDWLEAPNDLEKSYKLFKKAFSKKIENVISPVFYRMQKSYEEKLDGAKIEQFADEKQSVFRILYGKNESRITMRYPGYSKLIIYISHDGLDTPDNREITLPMNQITEAKIDEILESFINEFIGVYRHIYNS